MMWGKLKAWIWDWRGIWIATPSIASLVLLLRFAGLLQAWEWRTFDLYLRLRPPLPRDERIAIVGIEDEDYRQLGQGIIADEVYAELLEKLKAMEPRAIGLDIYRDLPVPPGREALVRVFESTPNLVGIEKVIGGKAAIAPPPALKAQGQVGSNDVLADADSTVRRGFVYLTAPDGETVYSFSFYLALLYLEREGIEAESLAGDRLKLGDTIFAPFATNDGGYTRADDSGYQVLINYRSGNRHFETVSLTDILEDRVPADWGRDRIILIGAVAGSANDNFPTPYSSSLRGLADPMNGVEIHAHLTSQFLSAALNNRSFLQNWSEPQEWLWILFWSATGAAIAWKWRYQSSQRTFALGSLLAPLTATGVLLGSTLVAFNQGWWLPVVPPLLALVGSTGAIVAYTARTASQIRKTFGRYLTDDVVANLLESPEGLKLGGQRQPVTILTSDLRGFTALSEWMPPEDVVTLLNIYLKSMLATIAAYQGTIDKFMGDGILVLFGAPAVREDDAKRAIACAIAMQQAMEEVNEEVKKRNLPTLEMGIGINTGEVVIGNIGSELHTEYTGIGSAINLAFRIETYTSGNQVLISGATLAATGSTTLKINGHKQVQPKGVKQPLTIYEIGGIGGNYNLFLAQTEEVFVSLAAEIPLLYQILEGKQISETIFKGSITKLSEKGAVVRADKEQVGSMPPPMSNLKLNFLKLGDRAAISEDAYAKVLVKTATQRTFHIHFTFMPPLVSQKLLTLLAQVSPIPDS